MSEIKEQNLPQGGEIKSIRAIDTAGLSVQVALSEVTHQLGIDEKVDKIAGKQLSTNDYTTLEKTKLSGVEARANNFTHPSGLHVTQSEKDNWNSKSTPIDYSLTSVQSVTGEFWLGRNGAKKQVYCKTISIANLTGSNTDIGANMRYYDLGLGSVDSMQLISGRLLSSGKDDVYVVLGDLMALGSPYIRCFIGSTPVLVFGSHYVGSKVTLTIKYTAL